MNFLQMKNRILSRVHDTAITEDVENMINDAYQALMTEHDWPFLQKKGSITTAAATTISNAEYELASDCRHDGIVSFWNEAGAKTLSLEEFEVVKDRYPDLDDTGSPDYVIPFGLGDNEYPLVILYPIPDDVYTINYRYLLRVDDLSGNTDTPVFHSEFHQIIVERALADAYEYEDDRSYNLAFAKFKRLLKLMKRRYSKQHRGQTFIFKIAADVDTRNRRRIY